MKAVPLPRLKALPRALLVLAVSACSGDPTPLPPGGIGGTSNMGGSTTGGAMPGGSTVGGTNTGGSDLGGSSGSGTGGTSTGGGGAGGGMGGSFGGSMAGSGASGGGVSGGGSGGMGGAAGGPAAGGSGPMFTRVGQILEANCGSKCHDGSEDQAHLPSFSNRDPAALHRTLTTPLEVGICFGSTVTTPGQGSSSLLVRVLKADIHEPCVILRMPVGCGESIPCLGNEDIMAIQDWIDAGARRDQ